MCVLEYKDESRIHIHRSYKQFSVSGDRCVYIYMHTQV